MSTEKSWSLGFLWTQLRSDTQLCLSIAHLSVPLYHCRESDVRAFSTQVSYSCSSNRCNISQISVATNSGSSLWIKWPQPFAIIGPLLFSLSINKASPWLYSCQTGLTYSITSAFRTPKLICKSSVLSHYCSSEQGKLTSFSWAKVSGSWPTTVSSGSPCNLGPSACGSNWARFRLSKPSELGTEAWNLLLYCSLTSRISSTVVPSGNVALSNPGASISGHKATKSTFAMIESKNMSPGIVAG